MAVAAFALGEVGFQCVANLADLDIGQMLDADEFGPRLLDRAQNLVELGLHRRTVAVLTVLDQQHGQDRKSAVSGKGGYFRLNLGVHPLIKKKRSVRITNNTEY